jgi:hypothetical protein
VENIEGDYIVHFVMLVKVHYGECGIKKLEV